MDAPKDIRGYSITANSAKTWASRRDIAQNMN